MARRRAQRLSCAGLVRVPLRGAALYRFASDSKAVETRAEEVNAFGGEWYAVSPSGGKVEKSSSSGGYPGGYGK
jgi:hypothetical protein